MTPVWKLFHVLKDKALKYCVMEHHLTGDFGSFIKKIRRSPRNRPQEIPNQMGMMIQMILKSFCTKFQMYLLQMNPDTFIFF